MKNSIIFILLFFSIIFSQKDDYSLYSKTSVGFDFLSSPISPVAGPNENQTGIYFTTHSAGMIFELYFGYKFSGVEWDGNDTENLWTIGKLGLLANMTPLNNKVTSYAGVRFGKAFYELDTEGGDLDENITIISPLIGMEYYISDNFSFSAEAEFENVIYNNEDSDIKNVSREIIPQFILRFYF